MDTLILPNAINTLNCHLYICVSPIRLIHLHKGFKKGLKTEALISRETYNQMCFFLISRLAHNWAGSKVGGLLSGSLQNKM